MIFITRYKVRQWCPRYFRGSRVLSRVPWMNFYNGWLQTESHFKMSQNSSVSRPTDYMIDDLESIPDE
jgi:hypothetical protein